jgi:hypothetical protein
MHEGLDIITACTAADLPVFRRTVAGMETCLPARSIHVFVPSVHAEKFQQVFGSRVVVHDEDRVFPTMRSADLAAHPHRVFPLMTGWFFQQFLKYSYAFENTDADYYLIWDADTVPMQPMVFFDQQGCMLMVPADEWNASYFETYRHLLGEEPHREYSFIAQHLLVQKSVLRDMLANMAARAGRPVEEWPWIIADGLRGEGNNLFSEYETYGHYLKNHFPERMRLRTLPWLREATEQYGLLPRKNKMARLAAEYAYATFESKNTLWRRYGRAVKHWFQNDRIQAMA